MSKACGNCGQPLTDPLSIRRGIGPDCWAKMIVRMAAEKDLAKLPFHGDLVVRRDREGIKHISIPHMIEYHSPTDLEWGYPGSGPAELALNTLFYFTKDRDFSFRHHQAFKTEFIEGLPKEGGRVSGETIRTWIEKRKERELRQLELFEEDKT